MITIEGLTKKQRAILDIMWSMDTKEQVQGFIQSLTTKDQVDATSLMEILIHDSLEQQGALADYEEIALQAVYTARYL